MSHVSFCGCAYSIFMFIINIILIAYKYLFELELGLHRTFWSLRPLKTTLISNMKQYIKEWCWLSLKIKSLHSHLNVFNKYGCPKRLSWWGIPPGHTWNEIHVPMLVHSQIMTNVHSYIGWLAQCTRACISNIKSSEINYISFISYCHLNFPWT